jgi:hypothetical protein
MSKRLLPAVEAALSTLEPASRAIASKMASIIQSEILIPYPAGKDGFVTTLDVF